MEDGMLAIKMKLMIKVIPNRKSSEVIKEVDIEEVHDSNLGEIRIRRRNLIFPGPHNEGYKKTIRKTGLFRGRKMEF